MASKKFLIVSSLFAALVASQDGLSCGTVIPDDLIFLDESVRPIAAALVPINASVVALDALIKEYEGRPEQVQPTIDQANVVLNTIEAQTQSLSSLTPLNSTNEGLVLGIAVYVASLGCTVNVTIADVIAKRQTFIDSCEGPTVLNIIQDQQTAAEALNVTVVSKLTEDYKGVAVGLEAPIFDALASGVAAFADQTTLPASCPPTTTSSTISVPTMTSSTTSSSSSSPSITTTASSSGYSEYSASSMYSSAPAPTSTSYCTSATSLAHQYSSCVEPTYIVAPTKSIGPSSGGYAVSSAAAAGSGFSPPATGTGNGHNDSGSAVSAASSIISDANGDGSAVYTGGVSKVVVGSQFGAMVVFVLFVAASL